MFNPFHSKSFSVSFAVWLAFVVSSAIVGGCAAPTSESSAQTGHAALDEGTSNPDDDEDLAAVKNGGFGTIAFATTCVSKGDDGSTIDGDSLPVGGGRWLECSTWSSLHRATMSVLSSKDDEWCALGQASAYHASGDPRLSVVITSTPDDGPWTLKATHDGDQIQITKVEASGALTWPLWVDASYTTTQLVAGVAGKTCDEVLGL